MTKKEVQLMVGTRKGGLILSSNLDRKNWEMSELLFKSWGVMHMNYDSRDGRLHAAVVHDVYGPTMHYSDNWGREWYQARANPAFTRPSNAARPLGTPEEAASPETITEQIEQVIKPWNITPGRPDESDVVFAGVEPAALFKSNDRGETWELNEPLYDHPHRGEWFPGAGGLALHTILLHPHNVDQMYVAISTGGLYFSDDGGQSWTPRNKNVRADFLPNKTPEYGQCVHKVVMHSKNPDVLYQQNHCGMYRSENGGETWEDIGEGKLPSRFGVPIGVLPHEPDTIFIVPEESDEFRVSIDGSFAVWRSKDRGESWERLTSGLPERAHLVVLREAMAVDSCEAPGVYIGTSTGQIFHTRDCGDTWNLLADFLPPIYALEVAVL